MKTLDHSLSYFVLLAFINNVSKSIHFVVRELIIVVTNLKIEFHLIHYFLCYSHRREYPPISLLEIQKLIDTDRIDITKPIDIASIVKSGLYQFFPDQKHFGINLTDEGVDLFAAKINIEVQWASEPVIAAIEKNGGVITTAYYDPHSLFLLKNPKKFFESGQAIPRRMIPPPDVIE